MSVMSPTLLGMYPSPVGKDLSAQQAKELDDTFLSSDPLSYFRSRIASLVAWDERYDVGPPADGSTGDDVPAAPVGSLRLEMEEHLRRSWPGEGFSSLDVRAQVAADGLAVRHHAAEALLRLAAVRLAPDPLPEPRCLWVAMADSPKSIEQVRERLDAARDAAEPPVRFVRAVVPPADRERASMDVDTIAGINVFVRWLWYAARLLEPSTIDVHGANNKVKHGLAVRARADTRSAFLSPAPDTNLSELPLSAFDDAVDVYTHPVLEFLANAPKVDNHRQGLELTQVHLSPAVVLAEAEMLAMTHGAMFNVAAVEHFADHDDLDEPGLGPPAHPGYPTGGPTPKDIDPDGVTGMRFPVTNPPGGGEPGRGAAIGFRNGFYNALTIGPRISGRIVDG